VLLPFNYSRANFSGDSSRLSSVELGILAPFYAVESLRGVRGRDGKDEIQRAAET
jgi:hypothetical protein